jgi:hypothetical protein
MTASFLDHPNTSVDEETNTKGRRKDKEQTFYPNIQALKNASGTGNKEEDDNDDYTGYRSPNHHRNDNCNTERADLVKFVVIDNEYVLVAGNVTEEEMYGDAAGGGLRRKLLWNTFDWVPSWENNVVTTTNPIIATSRRSELEPSNRFLQEEENQVVVYGRQCFCARTDDVYCPVGASLCRIITPNSRTCEIQCEGEAQGKAGQFMLPLVLFLYVVLACVLFASPQGRYTRAYMKKIIFRWSEERYQEELRKEIVFMARRAWEQRQRALAAGRNPNRIHTLSGEAIDEAMANTRSRSRRPLDNNINNTTTSALSERTVPVQLKTRIYGDVEQVQECRVCLGELGVGDRVGYLTCGHVFHVDPCLKKWIVRNNRCPLCQTRLADPCPETSSTETMDEQQSSTRSNVQSHGTVQEDNVEPE